MIYLFIDMNTDAGIDIIIFNFNKSRKQNRCLCNIMWWILDKNDYTWNLVLCKRYLSLSLMGILFHLFTLWLYSGIYCLDMMLEIGI